MNRFEQANALNIFADASILKPGDEKYYIGCPGIIAIFPDGTRNFKYQVWYNSTNNRSEMLAIKLAVEFVYFYGLQNKFDTINIFSDSGLCVNSLRSWYKSWYTNIVGNVLYKPVSSNSKEVVPVANQDVLVYILNLMCNMGKPLHLYHQKGHTTKTKKGNEISHGHFLRYNNIDLNFEELMFVNDNNNAVDKATRDILNNSPWIDVVNEYPRVLLENQGINIQALEKDLFII